MKDATRVIRAGIPDAAQGTPFLPGPTFAGTYHFSVDPATSPYTYGRYHNPPWTAYDSATTDLALGADLYLCSDTKAATGHSDLIVGHVSVRDTAWGDQLRGWRTQMGAAPGPMEVWLAHRSLGTLDVRLERQCKNALCIAEFLTSRPDVRGLRYPGLPTDPGYAIASQQMKFYGPVISFELASREAAETFLKSCELVYEATSLG